MFIAGSKRYKLINALVDPIVTVNFVPCENQTEHCS